MKKEYLVSAEEMRRYDNYTIDKIGMQACVLIERAAYAAAMEAMDMIKDVPSPRILILAGNGNNGADGVCTARILKEYGIPCDICLTKENPPYAKELQRQLAVASCYKLTRITVDEVCPIRYDLIIDAVFGIGLNREITGTVKKLIENINNSKVPVLSIDIPSGIDSLTGTILGCAVKADRTVTFGFYKRGQFFYPGRLYCGSLKKCKVAINETAFAGMEPRMFSYIDSTAEKDQNRDPMGNKGTFGKVFVIAGRTTTAGAAILCASSALRSGCGMTAVLTEKENRNSFLQTIPEIMTEVYTSDEESDSLYWKIQKWMDWSDCIVMGCGLLQDQKAYDMVKYVLDHADKSLVCDADALQLIARQDELYTALQSCADRMRKNGQVIVFTPHPGEMASLLKCSISDIKENRVQAVEAFIKKYPVILVAKDAATLVCHQDFSWYLNCTGNDGMATAGSGDVLAGLIASMLAQNRNQDITPFETVCQSVYYHGLAADYLASENGKSFLVASDLIKAYKYIWNGNERQSDQNE